MLRNKIMLAIDNNSIIIGIVLAGVIFAIVFIIKKYNQPDSISSLKNKDINKAQDFSSFEDSPEKENESKKDVDSGEYKTEKIRKDMSFLSELIDKLRVLPKDTMDDLQIYNLSNEDLIISLILDEDEGMLLEAYLEEGNVDKNSWSSKLRELLNELNLKSEEIHEDDVDLFSINIEKMTTPSCKQLIERLLIDVYGKNNNDLILEFCHY